MNPSLGREENIRVYLGVLARVLLWSALSNNNACLIAGECARVCVRARACHKLRLLSKSFLFLHGLFLSLHLLLLLLLLPTLKGTLWLNATSPRPSQQTHTYTHTYTRDAAVAHIGKNRRTNMYDEMACGTFL